MPLFSSRYAIRLPSGTWVPLERDEDMHRSVYCKLTKNLSGPHFEFVIAAGIMHLLTSRAAGPRAIEQVDVGIGEARVGIIHEDNYLGAQAKVCVAGGTASALEVTSGSAFRRAPSGRPLSVKLCGTGFTLGRSKVGLLAARQRGGARPRQAARRWARAGGGGGAGDVPGAPR